MDPWIHGSMDLLLELLAATGAAASAAAVCIYYDDDEIWFIIKNMDSWIHGSAAGAAARAAAGAAAGAAASAAAVCIYYVLGALTLGQRIKRELASHG